MDNGMCECGCGSLITKGKRFVSGHNGRGRRKAPAIIECINCKNTFEVRPYLKDRIYCSINCRDDHRRKRIGINNPLYKRTEISCEVCKKPVLVTQSMLTQKRKCFCSNECAKESHRIKVTGKPKTIANREGKNAARIRDGGKCVICDFNHVTAVHHIVSKKDGGSNKLTNLVTLCPNHHYMAHSGLIDKNELLKFATEFSFFNNTPVLSSTYKSKGPDFKL